MEEDEKIARNIRSGRVRLSIGDVVKIHAISDSVKCMFEALDRLLGKVPELIAC